MHLSLPVPGSLRCAGSLHSAPAHTCRVCHPRTLCPVTRAGSLHCAHDGVRCKACVPAHEVNCRRLKILQRNAGRSSRPGRPLHIANAFVCSVAFCCEAPLACASRAVFRGDTNRAHLRTVATLLVWQCQSRSSHAWRRAVVSARVSNTAVPARALSKCMVIPATSGCEALVACARARLLRRRHAGCPPLWSCHTVRTVSRIAAPPSRRRK